MNSEKLLTWYYAGTALFLVLDYAFHINVRVAFLDAWPAARLAVYAALFACLALILWRPRWATAVSTVESLLTLIALIMGLSLRVMVPNDAIVEETALIVTTQEILNFLIVGFAAYFAWARGMRALKFH